jgi:hypothetical protein
LTLFFSNTLETKNKNTIFHIVVAWRRFSAKEKGTQMEQRRQPSSTLLNIRALKKNTYSYCFINRRSVMNRFDGEKERESDGVIRRAMTSQMSGLYIPTLPICL